MKPRSFKPPPAPAGRENLSKSEGEPAGPIDVRKGIILALTIGLVTLVAYWVWGLSHAREGAAPTQPAGTDIAQASTNQLVPAARFQELTGKWVRPDGGYILQIRSADDQGKLDAAYFNPRPINVAKAVALRDGATTKVFVELRDINYPGSTYTLVYDPTADQLKGVYFQAVEQQQFEVFFERLKSP